MQWLRMVGGRRDRRAWQTVRPFMIPEQLAMHVGPDAIIDHRSPPEMKIALFRALFRGREDVYPRRFESRRTGKTGYQPACANEFLLQHTLRGAWHFQGYVVSDCDAVRNIFRDHHYRPTQPQASAISLLRGMDNECIDGPGKVTDDHDYKPYVEAVQQGYLPESAVDTALIRLFTARIRLGIVRETRLYPLPYSPPVSVVPWLAVPDLTPTADA